MNLQEEIKKTTELLFYYSELIKKTPEYNDYNKCKKSLNTLNALRIELEKEEEERKQPPKNLEDILKNVDYCSTCFSNAAKQYANYLKKHNYCLLFREVKGESFYFAVYKSYSANFKDGESYLIPHWAIIGISLEIYLS